MQSTSVNVVRTALEKTLNTLLPELENGDNFVENGTLDSIDTFTFLFELDKAVGYKILEDHEITNEVFTINYLSEIIDGRWGWKNQKLMP